MAEVVDHKNLVTHIANGKIGNICLICLTPLLNTSFESVFTLVCKEDTEYCVADALAAVCQVKVRLNLVHQSKKMYYIFIMLNC